MAIFRAKIPVERFEWYDIEADSVEEAFQLAKEGDYEAGNYVDYTMDHDYENDPYVVGEVLEDGGVREFGDVDW